MSRKPKTSDMIKSEREKLKLILHKVDEDETESHKPQEPGSCPRRCGHLHFETTSIDKMYAHFLSMWIELTEREHRLQAKRTKRRRQTVKKQRQAWFKRHKLLPTRNPRRFKRY